MTSGDESLRDPGRGGFKAVRWARFLQDVQAVHDAARSQPVVVGTYRADELRRHGVGVVQLWPPSLPRNARSVPRGIHAFQAMTLPPASTLWVAAATGERIIASLHVEFVGDIARSCEAVDVQVNGVGSRYVLRLEPRDIAVARCLDMIGYGPDGGGGLSRLRASFPWRWVPDGDVGRLRSERLPDEQMRNLVVRFSCAPGAPPSVTEQFRAGCADVPALQDAPSRAEMAAALDAFFGPHDRT